MNWKRGDPYSTCLDQPERSRLRGTVIFVCPMVEADLTNVKGVTGEQLERVATDLSGATMPNGQKYEDWLEDRKERGEDE